MSLTPEAQKIIGEAVVELLRRKRPAAPGLGDIGIPVKIGSAADVQALALLAAKLARLEPYGELHRLDPRGQNHRHQMRGASQARLAGTGRQGTHGFVFYYDCFRTS